MVQLTDLFVQKYRDSIKFDTPVVCFFTFSVVSFFYFFCGLLVCGLLFLRFLWSVVCVVLWSVVCGLWSPFFTFSVVCGLWSPFLLFLLYVVCGLLFYFFCCMWSVVSFFTFSVVCGLVSGFWFLVWV